MWLLMLQFFIFPQHFPLLFYLLTMITHATVLRKFLGSIRSLLVVYNAEEQDYFIKGVMGSTTLVQPKMEVSDSNTTANPSSNKVRIVRFNEDDFCTNFLGGVP